MRTVSLTLAFCLLTAALVIAPARCGEARPQFAQREGKPCGYCHAAAMGGGALTPEGKAFRKTLVTTGQRVLYFALYFLHLPFGVAWVGLFFVSFTAALRRGIFIVPPRQYTRVILYGIIVVAVSGPYVAYIRTRLTPGFFGTRMGILLLVKVAAVAALLAATVALLWHSHVRLARRYRELEKSYDSGAPLELAPWELVLFNGQGGRKALVAVDGRVYDVTARNLWTRGQHPGGHRAGFDLTDAFAGAPHGKDVFNRVESVGRLREDPTGGKGPIRWALLLGTAAGLAILLVVTAWRWV